MKIAIAGAGMAGAYLSALLRNEGFNQVDLFDLRKSTKCGSRPCAWGFAPSAEYRRLVSRFLDPGDYVTNHSESITIDGVKVKADMVTADKPRIIKDLIGDAEVHYSELDSSKYDRVVDATGVSRAFLGPVEGNDLVAGCVQYRIRSKDSLGLWFRTSTVGYEWCFPLGNEEYHIGMGSLTADVSGYKPFNGSTESRALTLCKCSSQVRLASPFYSQPFVAEGKTVGIGESIGAVGSLGADGNIYAMQCAEMLIDHWDDLAGYSEVVLKRYDWMRRERLALEKLREGRMPSLMDALTFVRHSRLDGFEIGSVHALKLFKKSLER